MNSKRIARVTIAVAAPLLLASCGESVSSPQESSGQPTTGRSAGAHPVRLDSCGTAVTVPKVPERVVGLSPSQTELLVRLGLSDRLVGQAQTETHPLSRAVRAEVEDVPTLSTTKPPSREALLTAKPDFVYSPTSYEFSTEQGFASEAQLRKAGAVAYVAAGGCFDRRKTGTVDDLFKDIDRLGTVFGVSTKAATVSRDARQRLNAVRDRIADRPRPTVAQVYVEGKTLSAIGGGVEYDIIKRAGGRNVHRPSDALFKTSPWAQISPESLAAKKPEHLVFSVQDATHEKQVRAYLKRTFPTMPAVRNGNMVALPASDLFPGTIGNVTAVERLAAELHPSAG